MPARLIQSETFKRSLDRLESGEQTQVKASVMDFFSDLNEHGKPRPGLRYHKIDRDVRDPGIRSITPASHLRVIVHQDGETYVLLYVDHHDPAYDWAARRRLQPNPQTGAMQLVNVEEVTQVVTRTITQTQTLLFAHYEPEYLMSLGIPEVYVEAVRHATEDNCDALIEVLPDEASERLLDLMDGKLVMPPQPVQNGDPYDHPDARKHFAVTTDEADLARAMQGRWEEWMVYLHPTQRLLAERHQSGPVKVSGSAGTGKTVVALHRAASLIRQRPRAKILLTSYSRPLAARLDEKLCLLLPETELRRHITVINLHRLATQLARQWHLPSRILSDRDLESHLRVAARATASELPFPLLLAEWHGVIEPQGLRSWEDYRAASRAGRGTPLGARQRRALWTVYEELYRRLDEQGETTWNLLLDAVTRALEIRGSQYAHAVVDEAQDLGQAEIRFLRALVTPGENDLFLCGDPGQRIYRSRSSWLACGIDVRGRAHRLKINYRTSRQIREYADTFLGQVTDEEGQPEHRRTVSRFSGPTPEQQRCQSAEDQVHVITQWVQTRLSEGLTPGEIAVFTRAQPGPLADQLSAALKLPVQTLDDQAHDPHKLTITTMHRAKGMEYRAVILAQLSADQIPSPQALQSAHDPADYDARMEEEKQLLYVASTRAREYLLVTWTGEKTPLLNRP